jgi:hypothetical protein
VEPIERDAMQFDRRSSVVAAPGGRERGRRFGVPMLLVEGDQQRRRLGRELRALFIVAGLRRGNRIKRNRGERAMNYSAGPWMGSQERVEIPAELRALDLAALAARIEETGDVEGVDMVTRQRAIIAAAACSPCARHAAEARLRMWLTRKAEA